MSNDAQNRMNEMRDLIAEIIEIDPGDITATSRFKEDHGADSMRAIEIMASLEKKYRVSIPQAELERMVNLEGVYQVIKERASWSE